MKKKWNIGRNTLKRIEKDGIDRRFYDNGKYSTQVFFFLENAINAGCGAISFDDPITTQKQNEKILTIIGNYEIKKNNLDKTKNARIFKLRNNNSLRYDEGIYYEDDDVLNHIY